MSFTIKAMPAHTIIILTLQPDFDPMLETRSCIETLHARLVDMPGQVSMITVIDDGDAAIRNANSLLNSLAEGQEALLANPKIRSMIVVTTDDMVALSALALGQGQVARPPILVESTLADAIALAT